MQTSPWDGVAREVPVSTSSSNLTSVEGTGRPTGSYLISSGGRMAHTPQDCHSITYEDDKS